MSTPSAHEKEIVDTMRVFRDAESIDDAPGFTVTFERRRRRPFWLVPSILLVTSILSMAWAGIVAWAPVPLLLVAFEEHSLFILRQHVIANWVCGLQFGLSLAAILGAHELGHYFVTRRYHIPSTLPLFIPFPISPVGTCGAVIMMDGNQADRKQIFDIGIAGPIAGLFVAIPIAIAGLLFNSHPSTNLKTLEFGQPLVIQGLDYLLHGSSHTFQTMIDNASMSPLLMAAWVGFLITGLNMVPMSQLDGGHVIFGLLGRRSRGVAFATYIACAAYVIYTGYRYEQPLFVLMLVLIPLMGIAHPPSRDDTVPLGLWRSVLGWASLSLPILCIPLRPIIMIN